MERRNYYHNQVVMEDELDAGFDGAEDAEHNIALDSANYQVETTDSPDCTEYGGILEGLVVARNGANAWVDVALGVCRDSLGRRILLPSAATVAITQAGATDEGDVSLATGDGALITTSCPSGQYIVCSLFLVYDEALSDPRLDGSGATVYFEVAESFHFDLQVGVSFTHPPGTTPSRASLANNKVLLTDLVLYNNSGSMEVVANGVCNSDTNWDTLGGNYANNTGRRSDWFAADEGANYPRNADQGISLRANTPREAIRTLLQYLQRDSGAGAPSCGAEYIGAESQVESENYEVNTDPIATPTNYGLSQGNIRGQLYELLAAMNSKAERGDEALKPAYGRLYSPEKALDTAATRKMISYMMDMGGDIDDAFVLGQRGIPYLPTLLHDDFLYADWSKQNTWTEYGTAGSAILYAGSGTPEEYGGVLEIYSTTVLGEHYGIRSGAGGAAGAWVLDAAPWGGFHCRVAAAGVSAKVNLGFMFQGAVSHASLQIDLGASTIKILIADGAGVPNTSASLQTPVENTYHLLRLVFVSATSVRAWVDDQAPITLPLLGGSFASAKGNRGYFYISAQCGNGGDRSYAFVDRVTVFDRNSRHV